MVCGKLCSANKASHLSVSIQLKLNCVSKRNQALTQSYLLLRLQHEKIRNLSLIHPILPWPLSPVFGLVPSIPTRLL